MASVLWDQWEPHLSGNLSDFSLQPLSRGFLPLTNAAAGLSCDKDPESFTYLFVHGVVGTMKDPSTTSWRETAGEAGAHVVRFLPGAP